MANKQAKPNTILNWMREGIPARFQDETKNMQEDIDELFQSLESKPKDNYPPLHPPSPLHLPRNATIKLHDTPSKLQLKRQRAITEEESIVLDYLINIDSTLTELQTNMKKIFSAVYANNHALRDIISNAKKRKKKDTTKL